MAAPSLAINNLVESKKSAKAVRHLDSRERRLELWLYKNEIHRQISWGDLRHSPTPNSLDRSKQTRENSFCQSALTARSRPDVYGPARATWWCRRLPFTATTRLRRTDQIPTSSSSPWATRARPAGPKTGTGIRDWTFRTKSGLQIDSIWKQGITIYDIEDMDSFALF